MAYGSELILGWYGKEEVEAAAKTFGLVVDWEDRDLHSEENLDKINEALKGIYKDALLEIPELQGCQTGSVSRARDGEEMKGYLGLQSPLGARAMSPWHLGLDYDPEEMGDRRENACLGVALTSRYFPVFLDWASECGGSGDDVPLNKVNTIGMLVARKHLMTLYPQFENAYPIVKQIHY